MKDSKGRPARAPVVEKRLAEFHKKVPQTLVESLNARVLAQHGLFSGAVTTLAGSQPPMTVEERNTLVLEALQRHKKQLLKRVEAECRIDPEFLDRLVKTIEPLRAKRGKGRLTPPAQIVIVESIMAGLAGLNLKRHEVATTIALTLRRSESHAGRLYDEAVARRR